MGQNKAQKEAIVKLRNDLDYYLRLAIKLATHNQLLKTKLEQERSINAPLRHVSIMAPIASQLLGAVKVHEDVRAAYQLPRDDPRAATQKPPAPEVVVRKDILVRAPPRREYTGPQLTKLVRALKVSAGFGM